jgi:PAS domain S-box-containing protein
VSEGTRAGAERALAESESRLAAQSAALTELTSAGTSCGRGFVERLGDILESCARTLGVERVSVWRFEDDRARIVCVDLLEAGPCRHTSGATIPRAGHEAYFDALERERLVAAHDARKDPRTREFDDHYLRPSGIGAMLDVPLRAEDRAVGVLCVEHVGGVRTWTVDEQNFALSVANLVAAATADDERRQALRRLEHSELAARLVIETATDAFVGIDADGRIEAWNSAAERTFGWTRDEVLGRPLVETIIPPAYREGHLQGMRRFHETGEALVVKQRLELSALHRDGHEFPVELSISEPIRRETGTGFGAFLRDITEPRRRQEELRRARDAAEAATRAKSDFLANMSHELRTPLNGVLGYAQLLRRDRELADKHVEAVDAIAACGAHLLDLINDVLDLSKIEAGKMDVEAVSTDLGQLVRDLRRLIAEPARRKGLAFAAELPPEIPRRVMLDGRHLRQVLLNLLSNAVKFTDSGSVCLTIRAAGPRLAFEVVDTGIGIDPREIDAIFEAFHQTRDGAAAGGSGLGLTISRRLVVAMGGELEVTSRPGQGSRFGFSVPLVADVSHVVQTEPEDTAGVRLVPGREITVLVVDDGAINRRIIASLLDSAGIRTLTAAGGAEALELAARQRPDLVLVDLRMPDVDGFEVARRLGGDPSTAGVPVVAVTASPMPRARERALEAGCRDFLAKPLLAHELYASIGRILGVEFAPAAVVAPDSPRAVPSAALAERIRRAARIGDLSELHAIARELERGQDEPLARLGRHVARLAGDFAFDRLERLAAGDGEGEAP